MTTTQRLVLLALVVATVGCGGDDADGPQPTTPVDAERAARLEEALLAPDELPGWDATRELDWEVLFRRCSEPVAGVEAVEDAAGIAFTRDHERFGALPGVTQSILAFADEAAAEAFMGALRDVYLTCLAEADVRPLGPAEELELSGIDLGPDAIGWRVAAGEPNPLEGTVDSSEGLFFRRGDLVASVGILLPLAAEVELLDLAATTAARLGAG